MVSTPFFSIVTITLNNLAGFLLTRASVEDQAERDFEWIVIDGASTDGTVPELQSCRMKNLFWLSEKDSGLYHAMNKGLARCHGRYIVFMNAADTFADSLVLEKVKSAILASGRNPQLVYGDAVEKARDGETLYKKARPMERLDYGMPTHHQAIFYAAHALSGLRFDESFRIAADYDLTCRAHKKGGGSLALDFALCVFERGGVSETSAHIGRVENWRVQRDVLGHSLVRRSATRTKYLLSSLARNRFQPLYNLLRYQHEHGSH